MQHASCMLSPDPPLPLATWPPFISLLLLLKSFRCRPSFLSNPPSPLHLPPLSCPHVWLHVVGCECVCLCVPIAIPMPHTIHRQTTLPQEQIVIRQSIAQHTRKRSLNICKRALHIYQRTLHIRRSPVYICKRAIHICTSVLRDCK